MTFVNDRLVRIALVVFGLVLASARGWAQSGNASPQATITSSSSGATNQTSIDVVVSFSGPTNPQGNPVGNVSLVELLVNGGVVASFDPPPGVNSGSTTFAGVNLSAFANTGVAVVLTARAYRGNVNAGNFGTSAPVSLIVDTLNPVISGVTPSNGSFTNDATPTIAASVSDAGGSGLQSVIMRLDGAVVPAVVTSSGPSSATVTFTPSSPLGEGSHTVQVEATDNATNSTTATSSFTVDVTPPLVQITVSPPETNRPDKTITVALSDNLSGLNASTRSILIDLVQRLADFTFVNGTGTLNETFSAGTHSVAAQVEDAAGNVGESTLTFVVETEVVDVHRPHLRLLYPDVDISKVVGLSIPIVARASDDLKFDTGIAAVELLVNGSVVASKSASDVHAFFYYIFTLSVGTTPGVQTIQVRARDNAGNERLSAIRSLTVVAPSATEARSFSIGAPDSLTAGTFSTARITPLDPAGNPIPIVDGAGDPVVGFVGAVEFRTTEGGLPTIVFFTGAEAFIDVPFVLIGSSAHVLEATLAGEPSISGHKVITVNADAPFQIVLELRNSSALRRGHLSRE